MRLQSTTIKSKHILWIKCRQFRQWVLILNIAQFNSSDAGEKTFWFWRSILCVLRDWGWERLRQVYSTQHGDVQMHVFRHTWQFLCIIQLLICETKKDSSTNEKRWHHFRILIADKWWVVWSEYKNPEFLIKGWKSLWSIAKLLVTSDRYMGEVILQLLVEAMTSHSNSTKPLPQLRIKYILHILSSPTTHYVCFLSGVVYS